MLIRRCRHAFGNGVASGVGTASDGAICIGTSATMASGGSSEEQRREVAKVSRSLFGVDFTPEQVVGETLERATPEIDTADPAIRDAIRDERPPRTRAGEATAVNRLPASSVRRTRAARSPGA